MDIIGMIEAGSANPLALFAIALVLGALHGLEPGHSKTMMAAYIIATRGTVAQAVLLGVSAAFSHSIIVWVLAILALTWGNALLGEELEGWFILASGLIVVGIGLWMLWNSLKVRRPRTHHHHHDHAHGHGHHHRDHVHHHGHGSEDAHARAHAAEIEARLASGRTSTWQTVLFGLSGGLIPCPAAITVFILCLNLGQLALGITLVSAFSIGLAVTLVIIGVVAALGIKYAAKQSGRMAGLLDAAPYLSGLLIIAIGLLIVWSGWVHL